MKKHTIILLLILCLLAEIFLVYNLINAQTVDLTKESQIYEPAKEPTAKNVAVLAGRVAQLLVGVSGAFLLLMFVYGGFLMLSAAGSQEQIQKGTDAIKKGALGFFIIVLSYLSISLLIYALTRVSGPAWVPAPDQPAEPQPQPPPPASTDCAGSQSYRQVDGNNCCQKINYSDGTTCQEAEVEDKFRCCDCGNTLDSVGYTCVKGPKTSCTDIVNDKQTCTLGDGKQYEILIGHCGKIDWWCSKPTGVAPPIDDRPPPAPPAQTTGKFPSDGICADSNYCNKTGVPGECCRYEAPTNYEISSWACTTKAQFDYWLQQKRLDEQTNTWSKCYSTVCDCFIGQRCCKFDPGPPFVPNMPDYP